VGRVALTANRNAEKLATLAVEFNAEFVALGDVSLKSKLGELLAGTSIDYGVGEAALIEAGRRETDLTLSAIMGAAGLEPTMAAVEQGRHVALANKECLVCAGDVFTDKVAGENAYRLKKCDTRGCTGSPCLGYGCKNIDRFRDLDE